MQVSIYPAVKAPVESSTQVGFSSIIAISKLDVLLWLVVEKSLHCSADMHTMEIFSRKVIIFHFSEINVYVIYCVAPFSRNLSIR